MNGAFVVLVKDMKVCIIQNVISFRSRRFEFEFEFVVCVTYDDVNVLAFARAKKISISCEVLT